MYVKVYVQEQIKIYSWKTCDWQGIESFSKPQESMSQTEATLRSSLWNIQGCFSGKGRNSNEENFVFYRKDKEHWGLILIWRKKMKIR